ncbi:MAG: hypothetical protein B7733_25925 [Myxococcales bacterium FL481]|nr:MAG: hypothetical protein B7733_25925 [Myxococcales bacterium FL481]
MLAVQQLALQAIQQRLARLPPSAKPLRAVLHHTCARWYKQAGDTARAAEHLEAALELLPRLRPALQLMSQLQLERTNHRRAVVYLDEEIRCTRQPSVAAALYRERGRLLRSFYPDPKPVEQCFRAALDAVEDDWATLRSLTQHAVTTSPRTRAEGLSRQRAQTDDPDVAACLLRELAGMYSRRAADLPAAANALLEALSVSPSHASLLADASRLADQLDDPELLITALARSTAPAGPVTTQALARLFALAKQPADSESLTLLSAYPRQRPHVLTGWLVHADLARESGRLDRTVASMAGALRAVASSDGGSRAQILYQVGTWLLEHGKRHDDDALVMFRRALQHDPDHLPARAELLLTLGASSDHLGASSDHARIASHLESIAGDDEETADHYLQAAERRLAAGEPDFARRYLDAALRVDPRYRPARDALDRLLGELNDQPAQRATLDDELWLAKTDARRRVVLARMAQLDLAAGQPARALTHLSRLLKLDRRHRPSLQRAAWIMQRAGGHEATRIRVIAQEMADCSSPVRRNHLARLTALAETQRDDDKAAATWWSRALQEVDDCLGSLDALERRCDAEGDHARRLSLLHKRADGTPCPRVQTYARLERAELLLTSRRGSASEALTQVEPVLESEPQHPVALYLAQHLTALTRAWARHHTIVTQRAALALKPRAKAVLALQLARTCAYALDRADEAREQAEAAVRHDPSLLLARQHLAEAYLHASNWVGLAELAWRDDGPALPHIWSLYAERMQLPASRAHAWHMAASAAEPHDNLLALVAIESARRERDWPGLSAVCQRLEAAWRADDAAPSELFAIRLLRAWAESMPKPAPGPAPATPPPPPACLRESPPHGFAEATWRRTFEPIDPGDIERKLNEATERAFTAEPAHPAEPYLALAMACERVGQHDAASAAFRAAHEIEPDHAVARLLACTAPGTGPAQATPARERWADRTGAQSLRAALLGWSNYHGLGRAAPPSGRTTTPTIGSSQPSVVWSRAWRSHRLPRASTAATNYAALAASTRDVVHRGTFAVASLIASGFAGAPVAETVVRQLGDGSHDVSLYDVLPALAASPQRLDAVVTEAFATAPERVTELVRNVDQALEAASQSVVLRERLARRQILARADTRTLAELETDLRYVRLHAGQHTWAHRRLAELYAWRGDNTALVDTLRGLAGKLSGPEAGLVYAQLAHELARNRAGAAALTALQRAAALCPGDLIISSQLAAAYAERGRGPEATALLDGYAERSDDAEMRAAAWREADLIGSSLSHDAAGAARRERLAALEPQDWASGYAIVEGRRASTGPKAHGPRLAALARLIDQVGDATSRAPLLVEYASVAIDSERDPQAGERALRRVLETDPSYAPARRRLDDYLARQGDHAGRIELRNSPPDSIGDPAVLALQAAALAQRELGDLEAHLRALHTAYAAGPDHPGCRDALVAALARHGRIERAYAVASAHDPPSGAPAAAHHAYILGRYAVQLSRGPSSGLHHAVAALDHFRQALEEQPDHDLAFIAAERLCLAYGDVDNLERLLRSQAATRRGPSQIVVLTRLARLLTVTGGPTDEIRDAYERARKLAPEDPLLLFEFEHWARQVEQRPLAAALLQERARRTSDPRYAAALYVEAAEHWSETNHNLHRNRTATAILAALRAAPDDPHAMRHLDRLVASGVPELDLPRVTEARTSPRARTAAEQAIMCLEHAELLEQAGQLESARRAYAAAEAALPGLPVAQLGRQRVAGSTATATRSNHSRRSSTGDRPDRDLANTTVPALLERAREAFLQLPPQATATQASRVLSTLQAVLQRDPNHADALSLTRAVGQRLTDPAPAMRSLAAAFPRLERAEVRHDIGLVLAEHEGPVAAAAEYLRAALEAQPDSAPALLALVRCLQKIGRTREITTLTERAAEQGTANPWTRDDRLALARQLAQHPETHALALTHTDELLAQDADDPRPVTLKAELCEQRGRLDEATALYDDLADKLRDGEQLYDVLLRRSRLSLRSGHIDARAEAAIERAAELRPGDKATLDVLAAVFERRQSGGKLAPLVPQVHAAVLANIERGSLGADDLPRLERVTAPVDAGLTRSIRAAQAALTASSDPPADASRVAVVPRLRQALADPRLMSRLLARREPAALTELIRAADTALEHIRNDFAVLSPADAQAIPTATVPGRIQSVLNAWLGAAGVPRVKLLACSTPRTAVILAGSPGALHISRELWMSGDATAWRGLGALAVARWLLAPCGARSLPPADLSALLAACFTWTRVPHNVRDPGPPPRVTQLVSQLNHHVPNRCKRAISAACHRAASVPISAATVADGLLATDLRLATILTGQVRDCLAAAALLDGHADGPLLQRVRQSKQARTLLTYCLRPEMAELRAHVRDES